LGAICGMLGSFAVLRKQSLLGDAISHAALPGIAIAFLITGTKETNVLLIGALVSGLLGAFWIRGITKRTHLKSDTALGLILIRTSSNIVGKRCLVYGDRNFYLFSGFAVILERV
jgi:manganese/zinc/iron transport system permease protein